MERMLWHSRRGQLEVGRPRTPELSILDAKCCRSWYSKIVLYICPTDVLPNFLPHSLFCSTWRHYSTTMSFEISEITSDTDFDELVEVEFVSFENPPNAFRNLFYPILGTAPDARQIAIKEATARIIQSHKSNPFSHWIKAVDPQSQRLVGAALWIFFESDPYTGKPLPECTWWPDGEGKDFTNIWWHKLMQPRIKYMSRRHACKNSIMRIS